MENVTTHDELPQAINIRTQRAIFLAKQLQYGDEPLTKTVERHLESAYSERQRREQATHSQ